MIHLDVLSYLMCLLCEVVVTSFVDLIVYTSLVNNKLVVIILDAVSRCSREIVNF
jgi:hypothetical protein